MLVYVILIAAAMVLGAASASFGYLCRIEEKDKEIAELKYMNECNEAYIKLMTEDALETIENRKLADKIEILMRENMELLRKLAEKRD